MDNVGYSFRSPSISSPCNHKRMWELLHFQLFCSKSQPVWLKVAPAASGQKVVLLAAVNNTWLWSVTTPSHEWPCISTLRSHHLHSHLMGAPTLLASFFFFFQQKPQSAEGLDHVLGQSDAQYVRASHAKWPRSLERHTAIFPWKGFNVRSWAMCNYVRTLYFIYLCVVFFLLCTSSEIRAVAQSCESRLGLCARRKRVDRGWQVIHLCPFSPQSSAD